MFFPEPHKAFANLHSLLRPSARIDLAVWGPPRDNLWMMEMMSIVRRYVDIFLDSGLIAEAYCSVSETHCSLLEIVIEFTIAHMSGGQFFGLKTKVAGCRTDKGTRFEPPLRSKTVCI